MGDMIINPKHIQKIDKSELYLGFLNKNIVLKIGKCRKVLVKQKRIIYQIEICYSNKWEEDVEYKDEKTRDKYYNKLKKVLCD